jgi:hypothetical protein
MTKIDTTANEMDSFLRGDRLYGDDMSEAEIVAWYADEGEGYANLGASDSKGYRYVYFALNWWHAYRKVNVEPGARVLGFGSAYGEELLPVLGLTRELTIIDPSDAFVRDSVHGVPCRYVKPQACVALTFDAGSFDLFCGYCVGCPTPCAKRYRCCTRAGESCSTTGFVSASRACGIHG